MYVARTLGARLYESVALYAARMLVARLYECSANARWRLRFPVLRDDRGYRVMRSRGMAGGTSSPQGMSSSICSRTMGPDVLLAMRGNRTLGKLHHVRSKGSKIPVVRSERSWLRRAQSGGFEFRRVQPESIQLPRVQSVGLQLPCV